MWFTNIENHRHRAKKKLTKESKIITPKKSKSAGDTSHYPKEVPFEVPEGWVWSTLGEFSYDLQYGTSEKSSNEGMVPVLRMGNITRYGRIDFAELVYSSNENDIAKFALQYDDLLFNRTNSSEWVGKTAIFKSKNPAIYAGYLIRVRTIKVIPDYLNLVMNSTYHRDWCDQVKTDAVNQSNINAQKLSCYLIPIPPLKEQRRIVVEAERYLTIVDQLQCLSKVLSEQIAQAKVRILDLAIHGKLVPQDPTEDPAIELLRRINPSFQPSHNLHYNAELPSGWQLCHIQDIAKAELGKTLDKVKNQGEEKPYLCALNVKWESFDFSTLKTIRIEEKEKSRYRLLPCDLLVCEGGDVGRCAIWQGDYEMYYQNALHRVRFKQGFSPDFYLYVLRYYKSTGVIDDLCKGVTIKHFTGQVFNSLDLPVPPLNEQKRIVSTVKSLFEILDSITNTINAS